VRADNARMSFTDPEASAAFTDRFVAEYLKDLNGTAAARRANPALKSPHTAASRLLAKPEVQERIAELCAERNGRVKLDADTVLREILAIATCDPNEIMEVRRGCCRHCYGIEHRYQYVDQRELKRAENNYLLTTEALVDPFEHGGLGFDARKEPMPDCPQCSGEGSAYVHVKDTRNLSAAARSLYAGAKQTKDGIEVKLHSKDKHLELLMRHLGLLNDKLEVTGDLGERIIAARKRARGAT
jgi:phage terminase small subunit